MREFWISCLQCALAIICGAPIWFVLDGANNGMARNVATLAAGFGGSWLLMKLYVRLRYGKGADVHMD